MKQCSLIDKKEYITATFPLITEKLLSDVDFLVEGIENIISKFFPNKAHGCDMISIHTLKLSDKSICKPLNIIFKSCLTQGNFPKNGKSICRTSSQKRTTSSVLKTTDLPLFSQSGAKF